MFENLIKPATKFAIGDKVEMVLSGTPGTIVGRSEYANNTLSLLVRHLDARGEQVESWYSEDALKKRSEPTQRVRGGEMHLRAPSLLFVPIGSNTKAPLPSEKPAASSGSVGCDKGHSGAPVRKKLKGDRIEMYTSDLADGGKKTSLVLSSGDVEVTLDIERVSELKQIIATLEWGADLMLA